MITFVILMAIAIIVAIIAAFILLTCGSVGCVIFSDLIVCVAIIVFIANRIRKRRRY